MIIHVKPAVGGGASNRRWEGERQIGGGMKRIRKEVGGGALKWRWDGERQIRGGEREVDMTIDVGVKNVWIRRGNLVEKKAV